MKKAVSLVLALIMCFSLSVSISAATVFSFGIQPYFDTAKEVSTSLSINGTTATCKSECRGLADVTGITGVQTLEKRGTSGNWTIYDSTVWTKTVNTKSILLSNTKSGLESGIYRLKTIFTLANSQGESETITVYSDEKAV